MSTYPFKLRLVRRGDVTWLEELAPSRGGSYFVKTRKVLPDGSLVEAAKATASLTIMGLGSDIPETPA